MLSIFVNQKYYFTHIVCYKSNRQTALTIKMIYGWYWTL